MRERREVWFDHVAPVQVIDLIFLDEFGASTNMARPHARGPRGERVVCKTPHGHWKTISAAAAPSTRVRRPGGGGKPLVQTDPSIAQALEDLVAPQTRGDPMSPLRWTLKSTSRLAAELTHCGHPVSARTVAALLKAADYSLQGNRKTRG